MSAGKGISLRFASEQHWNHVSQVEATSAAQTAQKGNGDYRQKHWRLNNNCGGILSGGVVEKFLQRKTSVCLSTSGGGRHTEVPYRAGFYGDLRKAVTRSGSFSGLISVLPQRRTCVQPLHPHFFGLPTQSDRHGWTQAANKTRIRRVTTHTGL